MHPKRLREILAGFAGKRVLVIGDLMLDRYLWGHTDRISPEAPVPVVEIESETFRPGGAGNVIHNLHELGAEVAAAGVVGDDMEGEKLKALLAAERVDLSGVVVDPTRPTTSKTRIIARRVMEKGGERGLGQHIVRADREVRTPIAGSAQRGLTERIREARSVDALFVSDYAKGVVTPDLMDAVREGMQRLDRPAVVDPKGRSFEKYHGVTAISPNQAEALGAFNLESTDEETVVAAGHEMVKRFYLQAVFMTRSEKGVSLFERNGQAVHIPSTAREVHDVSGAGDTTAAVYTLALLAEASHREAAYVGNLAGGVVVGKVGVVPVFVEELLRAGKDVS